MDQRKIRDLIKEMTLEEKAGLCSGADFWHTKGIERLCIPEVMLADGPHGLRKQTDAADHLGINDSIKAVCFPAGCATAASFDKKVARKLGELLGNECQAEGVSTILGPAMNIKRSPLCGRNFEYYSEDPLLSSEIAEAFIEGVQSKNVGTSPKHFVANNQEKRRMTSDSVMDERTLREIYLASFEGAVKNAKPWTIMGAYNKLNGTYICENKMCLTDILREEWGFDGYIMTDWGAVNDRVEGLKAGLDLEMPSSNGVNDQQIVKAVKSGRLEEELLDDACMRILEVVFLYAEGKDSQAVFDYEKDHLAARKLAEECIVLLKNQDEILPLDTTKKIAFIGKFAVEPRFQGGGSSHINSYRIDSALKAVESWANVSYAQGYNTDEDKISEELMEEAVILAKESEMTVIFAGLPDNFESEGYDRVHMRLPDCQNALIQAVSEVQDNVVVVLHNGSPVEMPWADNVKGIVEAYLAGEGSGAAVVNILSGDVNPSGRLPETFPKRLQDTPCYLEYGHGKDEARYSEGVFVGYRYYVSKEAETLFPFGYGLSYTKFSYSNLCVSSTKVKDTDTVKVSVDVMNTGNRYGKEVVQLYITPCVSEVVRPCRELKAFSKVELESGEAKTITFYLNKRAFAYWNVEIHDWYVENGTYLIQVCKNADEVILAKEIDVESTTLLPRAYTFNSTIGDIMKDPKGQEIIGGMMKQQQGEDALISGADAAQEAISPEMLVAMMEAMPLRQLISFVPGMTYESLQALVDMLNGE